MGFDLTKNDVAKAAEEGYEFELVMPGGIAPESEKDKAFIKVRGEQSTSVKSYARKAFTEYQMKVQAAKRRGKEYEMELKEAEEEVVLRAVSRIISWRGIDEHGKPVEFNQANALRILTEHDWICQLVMEESQQALNFRPK